MSIAQNLTQIQKKIEAAALRAGRDPKDITLVAVSKTKPASDVQEAYETGIREFGENYVQELVDKTQVLPQDIHWHMIGHLQRNKVKYILDRVEMIHSVDSYRLAKQISDEAVRKNIQAHILLEVNVAKEESKFGFLVEEVEPAIRQMSLLPNLKIDGLMTSAPFTTNPEDNREYFHILHQLCVDLKSKNIDNTCMECLSMGMTGDFEVAIEEGATHVRVGTAIFGHRDYSEK